MKYFFSLFFLSATCLLHLNADPISIQTANQVAQSFMIRPVTGAGRLKSCKMQPPLNLVFSSEAIRLNPENTTLEKTSRDIIPFYVFSAENQGYVIVAGDDRIVPILGYADEGTFNPDNMPPNMQKWLEGYKAEIRYAIENNILASPEVQARWQMLKSGAGIKSQNLASSVAPLIATKWDQSPYYNELCPYDNSQDEATVTGCVATAMAQVMKYWNYPEKGSGFHSYNHSAYGTLSANFGSTTYDWANMPTRLTGTSSSVQKNAVTTLMYHCGVSVEMNYNVASEGGSGAMTICSGYSDCNVSAEDALKTYFGYKNTLQGIHNSDYTSTDWINLLKTELNAGRPIIYAGRGNEGGHCFVADGYDNNNYFHFNWGWSGENDGYYALSALIPGSGGVGGGSYDFTDAQRAIIGIEPGTSDPSTQTYNLCLFSDLTMSSDQIWFTTAFDLNVSVANLGAGSFNGQLGVALFDNEGNFVDFMEVKNTASLNANSHFNITFNNAGSAKFVPGTYYAALFYKTATLDWTIVSDGSYTNLKAFEIYYSAGIEVNSAFTIPTNGGDLIQGQSATVNVDVKNTNATSFIGRFRVNLSNLDGTWAQNIGFYDEEEGLDNNYHYDPAIDFTGTITVDPGTYLMEVAYQRENTSNWYYAGSSNYSNPVYVIVKSPEIQPDPYENNNLQSQAYGLSLSFAGSNANKNSSGSNLHVGTDIDYYKIVLTPGYNYSINPRIHDSYNSGNGIDYTVDALFSCSKDGINYSETYDDVMTEPVVMLNGGTLYIKVAPYFLGNTGTYLLDLNITRSLTTAVENEESDELILVYPNPAADIVNIDMQNYTGNISQIDLCDVTGNQLFKQCIPVKNETTNISLSGYPDGIYMLRIFTESEIVTKKLVIKK